MKCSPSHIFCFLSCKFRNSSLRIYICLVLHYTFLHFMCLLNVWVLLIYITKSQYQCIIKKTYTKQKTSFSSYGHQRLSPYSFSFYTCLYLTLFRSHSLCISFPFTPTSSLALAFLHRTHAFAVAVFAVLFFSCYFSFSKTTRISIQFNNNNNNY